VPTAAIGWKSPRSLPGDAGARTTGARRNQDSAWPPAAGSARRPSPPRPRSAGPRSTRSAQSARGAGDGAMASLHSSGGAGWADPGRGDVGWADPGLSPGEAQRDRTYALGFAALSPTYEEQWTKSAHRAHRRSQVPRSRSPIPVFLKATRHRTAPART